MATKKPAGKETQLVRACLDYLALRKIYAWRSNSGGMKRTEASGRTRYIQFSGAVGLSDIIGLLPDGRFLAIEAKIGKNTPSEEQAAFLRRIQKSGGMAIVVYSLDDLIAALDGPKNPKEVTRCSGGQG